MKHVALAVALLLLGVAHWLTYRSVSVELRGQVFNLTGHLLSTALIGWVAYVYRRSPSVVLVAALVGGWTALVAGCSGWWLIERWPRIPGGDLCSDRLELPLGLLGMAAALLVARQIYTPTKKGAP